MRPTVRSVHWLLFSAHVALVVFAAAGLLVALPNPELWQRDAMAQRVYEFGMQYGAPVQIWLGALAVAWWGGKALGPQRVFIFALVSIAISLSAELIGTKTGWPFGGYVYLDGLGAKVVGRVPHVIPLSWFFMGLVSYVLGTSLAQRIGGGMGPERWVTVAGLGLGAGLLVLWDLILDPAMAHERLPARFWLWFEDGHYFGMPLQNFAGWAATGLTFMGLSRLLWRSDPRVDSKELRFPLLIYLANIGFAAAVTLGVGLWKPVVVIVSVFAGLALLAWLGERRMRRTSRRSWSHAALRLLAAVALRRVHVRAEGFRSLPSTGPVIVAARHVHHLYDGAILLRELPRAAAILVALDWAGQGKQRRAMETLCRFAGWPFIDRAEGAGGVTGSLFAGIRGALAHLRSGGVLVVFPEGKPVYDPHAGDRTDTMLPFERGVGWLAVRSALSVGAVPVVPVGFTYRRHGRRWEVLARAGEPIVATRGSDIQGIVRELERALGRLSAPTNAPAYVSVEVTAHE